MCSRVLQQAHAVLSTIAYRNDICIIYRVYQSHNIVHTRVQKADLLFAVHASPHPHLQKRHFQVWVIDSIPFTHHVLESNAAK